MVSRLEDSLNVLSSMRANADLAAVISRIAPAALEGRVDKQSELYKAFASFPVDMQFTLFASALDAAHLGHLLVDLIAAGKVTGDDLEHLKIGTRAIRTVDFHAPGASEDCNGWFELRMRYVQVKVATAEWHNAAASFSESASIPDQDAAQRHRALAAKCAAEIDIEIERIDSDIAAVSSRLKEAKPK